MLQYIDLPDDEYFWRFTAEDQCWDKETLQQLKKEYNVIFMTNGDGVIPIMVSEKWGIILGHEDDGTIEFRAKYGQPEMCFSKIWVEDLIADLQEACRFIESGQINTKG